MLKQLVTFALAALLSTHVLAISNEKIKLDCKKIPTYANMGTKAYQAGEYDTARQHFTKQASWSQFCQLAEPKLAVAYNNVALTYIRQQQWLKAKAWLSILPDDSKSKYNLALIADKLLALPHSTHFIGEYWQYAGIGSWNKLKVTQSGEKFDITFSGLYFSLVGIYYGPNLGDFNVTTDITNQHAVYQDEHCKVDMEFTEQDVTLTSTGECGFGHGVYADGKFIKVTQ